MRLVVPWKYGFKHIKSITKIKFVEKQPLNTWQDTAAQEYGFFCERESGRGSSALEPGHRGGASASSCAESTLMFNGYGDQVASLYSGMDLKRNSLRLAARARGWGHRLKLSDRTVRGWPQAGCVSWRRLGRSSICCGRR